MKELFYVCIWFSSTCLLYSFIFFGWSDYAGTQLYSGTANQERELFSQCRLAEFDDDGWTLEVLNAANVAKDPLKNCNTSYVTYTVLGANSTMWIRREYENMTMQCYARTIRYKEERKIDEGPWVEIFFEASEVIFNSDVVHAQCWGDSIVDLYYEHIHSQIYATSEEDQIDAEFNFQVEPDLELLNSTSWPTATMDERPSVHIIVLDSVANSQSLRSLPHTVAYLRKEFGAVNFRHVNKVGANSRPNAFALFLGKMISKLDRSVFGLESDPGDIDAYKSCKMNLDNEPFILCDFTKAGYKTFFAEDWALGAFTWPDCIGFEHNPVTHNMRPFQLLYEKNTTQSRHFMGNKQCLDYHHFLFDHLKQFLKTYLVSPTASITWASELAHNQNDNLFHADEYFFNFFRSVKSEFENSFVFFMGDHGINWGYVRNMWTGERESKNPMMYVSVPKKLRERLLPQMKKNADALLTSFDIHASFVDIFNNPFFEDDSEGPTGLRGNSIFRELPPGERTCRTLPIPVEFCLCEWNRTVPKDHRVSAFLSAAVVDLINTRLKEENVTDVCETLNLQKGLKLSYLEKTAGLYEVSVKSIPCHGQFQATVRLKESSSGGFPTVALVSNDFARLNSYGSQANCVHGSGKGHIRHFCCCKDRNKTTDREYD